MRQFIARYAKKIMGTLLGFDRVLFRGLLPGLNHERGLRCFLAQQQAMLKDFGRFSEAITRMIRAASSASAREAGAPEQYLMSSRVRKEDVAKKILDERGVDQGLVCVLSAVEPCWSWQVFRSKERRTQTPQRRMRKCLHLYHYFADPDFGLMHIRIQTWIPFTLQVCVNGREWLARQMDRAGLGYTKVGNCFTHLDDPEAAQEIMDRLPRLDASAVLDRLAQTANPALSSIIDAVGAPYYWTGHQTEWATDVLFRRPSDLAAIYPYLSRHSITDLGTKDVLRFLGKKHTPQFQGEVLSDYKQRAEGVRIKHSVAANSVKMYDKAGSVLRVETTVQDPSQFKIVRKAQGDPRSEAKLRPIRKTVIDFQDRAHASNQVNDLYLDALVAVDPGDRLHDILQPVLERAKIGDRHVRALRPFSEPDLPLLRAISSGEFITHGFRNRDIFELLHPRITDEKERRRLSARITRLFRILRAHGLIRRVEGSYRYQVTAPGRRLVSAVIAARDAALSTLRQCA